MSKQENENEVNLIRNEMKENLSIRTTLLTFCFTSVITTIGFGINDFNTIPFMIYLIPIIITITFSCRITYYKDKQCRMNAYLNVYYNESVKHEIIYEKELNINDFCIENKFCSFVINNELLILSVACSIVYYIKFFDSMNYTNNKCAYIFYIILPIILLTLQYAILSKVPSYSKKTKNYIDAFTKNKSNQTLKQEGN